MTLSSYDFLFHRSLNMRKHIGQIPQIIVLMCIKRLLSFTK